MSASNLTRVFRRDLPGGGHVAIDVAARRSLVGRRRFEGCVVVERRSAPARHGIAPVVARANGKSVEAVIQQLLPCALSNAAIGAALLRCSGRAEVRESPTALRRFPYGREMSGIAH
jgi:hypothetical protein